MPSAGFTVTTSHPVDPFLSAYATGAQHAEYLRRILDSTPLDRQAALVEGAAIRLRGYVAGNLPSDAPAAEIIEHAMCGFEDELQKESN
jgi:hypothetical protein